MDKTTLLQKILATTEYSSYTSVGDGHYRDTSKKNPHLDLSIYGLYDHKTGENIKPLIKLAKELNIMEQKKYTPADIYSWRETSDKALETCASYFKTRKLELSHQYLKVLGVGLSSFERNGETITECVHPIYNLDKKIVKINKIQFDPSTGEKIGKKIFGKSVAGESWGLWFGNYKTSKRIVIFEGLEDAITWNKATTDFVVVTFGAGNFKSAPAIVERLKTSDKVPQAFKDCEVIAIIDPDEHNVSQKKSEILKQCSFEIKRLIPPIVDDDLEPHPLAMDANKALKEGKFSEWKKALQPLPYPEKTEEPVETEKTEEPEERTTPQSSTTSIESILDNQEYQDHRDFALNLFCKYGRCLVRDELFVKVHPEDEWTAIENRLDMIRGAAATQQDEITLNNGDTKLVDRYKGTKFQGYIDLYHYHQAKKKLLVDVPEWDGVDRVRQITDFIECKEYSKEEVYFIFKEWLAKMYLRIYQPGVNQHLLAITGGQGKGKDSLIDALTGGLDWYKRTIKMDKDQTRLERQMQEAIVGIIDEFDKGSHADAVVLKDIITTNYLNFDQKYVKGSVYARNLTSFIATANVEEVLRDTTGNRRYRIIKVEDIALDRNADGLPRRKHHYPGDELDPEKDRNRLQLIAQYKFWAENCDLKELEVNEELGHKIALNIAEDTPEDTFEELAVLWCVEVEKLVVQKISTETDPEELAKWNWIQDSGVIALNDASEVVDIISKMFGNNYKRRTIASALKKAEFKVRSKKYRFYPGNTVSQPVLYKFKSEDFYDDLQDQDAKDPCYFDQMIDDVL